MTMINMYTINGFELRKMNHLYGEVNCLCLLKVGGKDYVFSHIGRAEVSTQIPSVTLEIRNNLNDMYLIMPRSHYKVRRM